MTLIKLKSNVNDFAFSILTSREHANRIVAAKLFSMVHGFDLPSTVRISIDDRNRKNTYVNT